MGKRRRARFVQNPELLGDHLHFAGGQVGIDGVRRRAAPLRLPRRSRIPGAPARRACARLGSDVLVEDHLRDAVAVAQINEDHAAHDRGGGGPSPSARRVGLRRRRAARRRYACGEARRENLMVRRFPYRSILVIAARSARRFPRASRSAARRVAMSFNAYVPAAISLSPTISAKRAPSLLASSMARFSLPSADFHRHAAAPQFARQHGGVAQRRARPAAR